jgi:hypothetical protein
VQSPFKRPYIYFKLNFDCCFKENFTNKINTGTSTNGPITAANATPEFIPKTPIATAIPNSKLLPAAVNAKDVDFA